MSDISATRGDTVGSLSLFVVYPSINLQGLCHCRQVVDLVGIDWDRAPIWRKNGTFMLVYPTARLKSRPLPAVANDIM